MRSHHNMLFLAPAALLLAALRIANGQSTTPSPAPTNPDPAINPPPVSLEVKDATLEEIAARLTAATGRPVYQAPYRGGEEERAGNKVPPPPLRFTLNAKDKTFWEILRQLDAQHRIIFSARNTIEIQAGALRGESSPFSRGIIVDGFFVNIPGITRSHVADYQAPKDQQLQPENLDCFFSVTADPRIFAVAVHSIRVIEALDDAGKKVAAEPLHGGGLNPEYGTLDVRFRLSAPQNQNARGISLKLEVDVVIGEGEIQQSVADVQKMTGPLVLKRQAISVMLAGRRDDLCINQIYSDALYDDFENLDHVPVPVLAEFIGAAGKSLAQTLVAPRYSSTVRGPDNKPPAVQGPTKLILTEPQHLKISTLKLAFKNLPIPP